MAYNPQQNGKIERGNRVIVEMARSMMNGAQLPQQCWADAVVAAAYIRNRCPTSVLNGKSPMEMITSSLINLDHLRIFGSKAQIMVPKEKRHKLDVKAQSAVFVG